ncbi:MAG: FAD-binding domain-containing protein [Polyangiales bacterium]
MTRALVWFRRDLRVSDHPALSRAVERHRDGVVAAFALTPAMWRAHDDAPAKVDLWLRCADALSRELAARNIPLVTLRAEGDDELAAKLLDLATRGRCAALLHHREYEVNERRRDERVRLAFAQAGLEVEALHDRVAVPPDALRTGSGGAYRVFTPYRRAWSAWLEARGCAPLAAVGAQPRVELEAAAPPASLEGFEPEVAPGLWPAGELRAQARLARFVDERLADYHRERDLPATDGTSALSPYLAAGVISPRQCLQRAVDANGGRVTAGEPGPLTWISELAWRDFYQQVLVNFPRVSMGRAFQPATEAVRWRDAPDELARWEAGETGFPLVDAAMRQLRETGWMHNRLRMLVSMFLTKDLLIDWRAGERFFMRHLVDGDLAANNGGWQWSASTGTDAQPWFRVFNPWTQSARFDPDAAFVKRWIPALKPLSPKGIHTPEETLRQRLGYPPPMVDHASARLRALAAFGEVRGAQRDESTVPQ